MKKRGVIALVTLLLLPGSVSALEVDDLVAIAAMPLAVAAVAEATDVPASELISVVSALNRAQVPAPQFVEVVRYVPVVYVDNTQPAFSTYVNEQVDRGIYGEQLAYALEDRFQSYGVTDIDVRRAPGVVLVEERTFIPTVVRERYTPVTSDPLALIAMPLAVAAVAELTDVPVNDLVSLVSMLNRGSVPPAQFVEVVRYAPVALVDPRYEPQFMTFVTTRVNDGYTGLRLAEAIEDQIESFGFDEINVVEPPIVRYVDYAQYIPPVVAARVAAARSGHPHGGPPGQLKKELGYQTGAEVVHGSSRVASARRSDRADGDRRVTRDAVRRDDDRPARVKQNRGTRDARESTTVRRARDDRREKASRPDRGTGRVERSQRPERVRVERGGRGGPAHVAPPRSGKSRGADAGAARGNGGGKGNGKGKGR